MGHHIRSACVQLRTSNRRARDDPIRNPWGEHSHCLSCSSVVGPLSTRTVVAWHPNGQFLPCGCWRSILLVVVLTDVLCVLWCWCRCWCRGSRCCFRRMNNVVSVALDLYMLSRGSQFWVKRFPTEMKPMANPSLFM